MEAITREEKIISGENLTPITRKEMFLAKAAGMDVETPEPITREEMFLSKIAGGGNAGGGITPTGTIDITENGEYDVTTYEKANVNVASSGGGPGGGLSLDEYVSSDNITHIDLPNATSIRNYAFYLRDKLETVNMPNVTSIGRYGFYSCSNLALTSLPSGVTSIGGYAFYSCSNLALTSLPSGVTSIGNSAFFGCSSLKTITFEGKPTKIDNNAFRECPNLITINVPWAEGAVANAPWGATNATINYNYTGE